jgi:hypothetical protein
MVSFGVAPVAAAYGLGMRSGLDAVILVQLANAPSCPWRERRLVREGWTKQWR